jgi:hypothetical protein
MVAMIVLLKLCLRARTIAASMAIDGPEAIDAASLATAAPAEDGAAASFLFREEWRRSRQGKKVAAAEGVSSLTIAA